MSRSRRHLSEDTMQNTPALLIRPARLLVVAAFVAAGGGMAPVSPAAASVNSALAQQAPGGPENAGRPAAVSHSRSDRTRRRARVTRQSKHRSDVGNG